VPGSPSSLADLRTTWESVSPFEATDPTVNVATSFSTDCRGCHLPARATDWIFVQGYPGIREAYRKEARPNSK